MTKRPKHWLKVSHDTWEQLESEGKRLEQEQGGTWSMSQVAEWIIERCRKKEQRTETVS